MASSSCFCKRNRVIKPFLVFFIHRTACLYHICHTVNSFFKILHSGERAQLCVIQSQHVIETDTLLSPAYGIPVHIWCFASWELRCAS